MSRPTVIARCPICGRIPFASVEEYMDGESQAQVAELAGKGYEILTVTNPVTLSQCNCQVSERVGGDSRPADVVNHPPHYTYGKFECIDVLVDLEKSGSDFRVLNAIKYLWRWKHKAKPLEDLRKARWYLDHLIAELEPSEGEPR